MAKIRSVVNTTAQIKARQRITGRSGQLGYAIDSGSAWDYTTNVAYNSSTYQTAKFQVTFTSDGTQRYPIVVPQFDVRINGTAAGNRMTFDPSIGRYKYQDAVVSMQAFDYGRPIDSFYDNAAQSAWYVTLFHIGMSGSGTFSLNIKVRAQGSCNGSFSIVRLS